MELRVAYDDLQTAGFDSGGGEILHYKGKAFTGMVLELASDGTLIHEEEFKNGHRDGIERSFFPNGQKQLEGFIRFNNPYGLYREWDINGNLIDQYDWGPEP
ncbi:toxin-antitoxin system YwqK family antitoxin [Mucilaginibacter sp. Mucisp84]|uniref:toxin-antitoxin system YwqK family antitoxin n=1 Tax=Mucilaginibacter sp. Mucisp84 TaxID=3243058 RepID=UPI0039A6A5B1